MTQYVLPLNDLQATLDIVGGKGASLAKLATAGLPVPAGFHITTDAYKHFVAENALQPRILAALQDVDTTQPATLETASAAIRALFTQADISPAIAEAIRAAYTALPHSSLLTPHSPLANSPLLTPHSPPVAVRSSATAEDLPDASFAGQQDTYLNIQGEEAVLDAVRRCWASLWTARAIGYRARQGIDPDAVSLAVVVQTLVPADAAGIMFTANPLNGRRDEVVINAAWGLGEAVVGGLVTPDTYTVDKANAQITAREIADKQVMTIRTPAGTEEQPVPAARRAAQVLADAQIADLTRLGAQIETLYGAPQDIEWCRAEGNLFIVQSRPITTLGQAPPTAWQVPYPKSIYYRASIVELLPDPLTPLFATLGGRAINTGSARLFADIAGPGVMPEQIFVTINDYAYYQMYITFKVIWRMFAGIPGFWPKFMQGEPRWRDEARPHYLAVIEQWRSKPLAECAPTELLDGAHQMVAEAVNIYNVFQSGVVGLAMLSEVLFTFFYNTLVKRRDDPPALTFLLGFDSVPILAEKSLYDLAEWTRARPDLAEYVRTTPTADLAAAFFSPSPPHPLSLSDFHTRLQTHLDAFGHVIYDLDFARPVPADDPTLLLETCKLYLTDQGVSPYVRQQEQIARREAATQAILARLKGLRLKWFRKLLGWRRYIPMREDALADIGLGYPLLRQMLRELGRRLVSAGMIAQADDVYWLYEAEARQAAAALEQGAALDNMAEVIRQRQALWRAEKQVTPPATLPERTRLSGVLNQLGPARVSQKAGDTLKGAGSSPGRVTAPACVLHGPEDFDQMRPGAVLVAAITTPAWTPLFVMAAAVVTDIGGPLSHGSIVAREYGIPAVLGTGVATQRIHSGQTITVDGSAGTVTLES